MKKKLKKELQKYTIWIIILFLLPLITYIIVFAKHGLSIETKTWSDFGSFIGGFSTLIFGAANLFFLLKISFTIYNLEEKRNKQNQIQSVKPLGVIISFHSLTNNYILLEIHNNGIGPMIIKNTNFELNNKSYNNIRTLIEDNLSISNLKPLLRSNNISDGISIPSNSKIELMWLTVDESSNFNYSEENIQNAMNRIITEMNKIKTKITYTDILKSKDYILKNNY
ncbi:hypothetical protein SAMN05421738_11637 [Algoriella xinjiangensis]|uniref:Uncharacterized protein n=1 Tax=Algoriella xinjiangensis TaxID=684065 RepID=A0A1I5ACY1_9FLAO|nr:hypothetical protein [Algoriella xinjiangensis]SFN60069.1 hypothetical protein SAMN05421738_11637 [Algoriella xinjiangensis]VDH15627.1 Uncharacterised protein [Algoriella xinjiangensis]VDH15637.1 Uncharacterised protein [Algoriella xinjiangensis]